MKSEWKVSFDPSWDGLPYGVYRRLNIGSTDHSGNRENREERFAVRRDAEKFVTQMNKENAND